MGVNTPLVVVHLLGDAIWIGGIVTLLVVRVAAHETIDEVARVEFFRALGRRYGIVAGVALLVALVSGGVLAGSPARWTAWLWTALGFAIVLIAVTAFGVRQARALGRLRACALDRAPDDSLQEVLRARATSAMRLRAAIGLITLALLIVGAGAVR